MFSMRHWGFTCINDLATLEENELRQHLTPKDVPKPLNGPKLGPPGLQPLDYV